MEPRQDAASPVVKALSRLPIVYDEADRVVSERLSSQGAQAQCRVGCAHCCYHLVPATLPEVMGALVEAIKNGHKKLVADFQKVRKDYNTLQRIGWDEARWFKLKRPCLFLVGNRCAAYNARPVACRSYVAISHPDKCRDGGPVEISDAAMKAQDAVAEELASIATEAGTTSKKAPMQALLPYAMKALGAPQ